MPGTVAATPLILGAPGIYEHPDTARSALAGVQMDVCAFVGVSPRGPVREPLVDETWRYDRPCVTPGGLRRRSVAVPVESFDQYRRLFGDFSGPGRLPYTVASFFEQGGRRAYIVRIVHDYHESYDEDPILNRSGVARGVVWRKPAPPSNSPVLTLTGATESELTVGGEPDLAVGSLLSLPLPGGAIAWRVVTGVELGQVPDVGSPGTVVTLDLPLSEPPESAELVEGILLEARNEGSWGNGLQAALGCSTSPLAIEPELPVTVDGISLGPEETLPTGSLLRFTRPDGTPAYRFAADVRRQEHPDRSGSFLRVTFDRNLEQVPEAAELVEGTLVIDDGAGGTERHERLGFSPVHPRWAGTVLCYESVLVYPHWCWGERDIELDESKPQPDEPSLNSAGEPQFTGGEDRYADIRCDDFFDSHWTQGDPDPGDGVHALTHLPDLSTVVAPDLYSPEPLVPTEPVVEQAVTAGPTFERCLGHGPAAEEPVPSPPELGRLHLDPEHPTDLETIILLQNRLVGLAEMLRSFVVLLDVPPGLSHRGILQWRSAFRSSYSAAYYPWLRVSRGDDRRDALIRLNPSGPASGIIAHQELLHGVPHGPANLLAAGVVDVDDAVSPALHDELHPLGINVFLRERDGIRLSAGRTLSRDPKYRQLTVRRLILMLRRVLEQQTNWMVFEANTAALRADMRAMLRTYLRHLHRTGAFSGANEEEAFFVRCDDELNNQRVIDAGKLIAEIGVAPSEPLEFIVLRVSRGGDGTLLVEA